MTPQLLILIHGILTTQSATAWQEELNQYIFAHYGSQGKPIGTLEKEYWAGTFPVLNVCLLNPCLASSLAAEIETYLTGPEGPIPEISFIAHSNGADVAIDTMFILANRAHKVKSCVLIAGAVNPDISRNGIKDLVDKGDLGRAFAYWSPDDQVLGEIPGWALWPYGRLGQKGFNFKGDTSRLLTDRIKNRPYPGFDHGTYFAKEHRDAIFAQAVTDCCFTL